MAEKKRFYWLKLMSGFFSQPKIKKLRRIAGGDTYTIIYLKLQLLSLKDDGWLYFEGIEETFADELALVIDEKPEDVDITLRYLESKGLIMSGSDSGYILTETQKLIGAEGYSAERVRRCRERKALQCNEVVTSSNAFATKCNEEDRDKRIDIEKREEIDYQSVVDTYNRVCTSFPKLTKLSDKRKKAIKARFNQGYTVEDFKRLFELAEGSDFLKGKNARNWSATFDWLITDGNMVKVLDGNYINRQQVSGSTMGGMSDAEREQRAVYGNI